MIHPILFRKQIKFLFSVTFFFAFLITQGQNVELEKRNGFKSIKLGSPIDSIKGIKIKKDFTIEGNVHPSYLYTINDPEYEKIGDIGVKEIEAKVYRGLIYEIVVITEKDPRLMRGLEQVLGKPAYDQIRGEYYWASTNLTLIFDSHSKKELKLHYKSFVVPKMMQADKMQKVDEISSDF